MRARLLVAVVLVSATDVECWPYPCGFECEDFDSGGNGLGSYCDYDGDCNAGLACLSGICSMVYDATVAFQPPATDASSDAPADGSVHVTLDSGCTSQTFASLASFCGDAESCLTANDASVSCGSSSCGVIPFGEIGCGSSADCAGRLCCTSPLVGAKCPRQASVALSGWATWCAATCSVVVCTSAADCGDGGQPCDDTVFPFGGPHFGTCH